MSTRYVNGRKMTTQRSFQNGVETVKEFENDVLVSHTVNGHPAAPGARGAIAAGSSSSSSSAVSSPSSPYHRSHRRHHH